MPPKQQRRVTLSAGEECTVSGSGFVQVTLLTGVIDVAGVLLEASRPLSFYLSANRRSIILFTLEGGSASVASEHSVEVHKSVTGMAPLVQLTRRTLLSLERSKVLVIGKSKGGKTLAAHSICNLLLRYGSENDISLTTKTFLLDLNAESNSVYAPGCVTVAQAPETPLLVGRAASPSLLTLSLYTGAAARPSARTASSFLHFSEQLHDTATSLIHEVYGPTCRYHMVIDAPTPLSDLKEGVFYKKLIETVKPTHVVIVGSRDGVSDEWCTFLQEDVQRVLPDCDFVFFEPVFRPCAQPATTLLLPEYFVGTTPVPLGCSKVVASSQSLVFTELVVDAQGTPVGVKKVRPNRGWRGLVCALSHAAIEEEVPFAPVAGLATVALVDEENDEVVLVLPANADPLPRRIVVVPSSESADTLRLSEVQLALLDESVTA